MTHLRRPIGDTGVLVGPLGLGTVKIGRLEGLKHAVAPGALPDDGAVRSLLRLAMDLGVNLIDTAPAYGVSEERLGALLPGSRRDWAICTKVGEEFERGVSRFDFSPGAVRESVERSLRRLRVDVLDVVLIHSDGGSEGELERTDALEALRDLQRAGLVRAVGASTKTPAGAERAVRLCDVAMLTRNLEYSGDDAAIALAGQRGVGVLVKKPLAQGRLGPGASEPGEPPERAAFRHVFASPGVTAAVVGTTDPQHLRSAAIAAAEFASTPAPARQESARTRPPAPPLSAQTGR